MSTKDYSEIAKNYAEDVVSGKIPACIYVRQTCQRHLDDLNNPDLLFEWAPGYCNHICDFAEHMVHVKGKWAGQPIHLEPWQVFCFGVPFGWVRKKDGYRRFREMYICVPRKNGKSLIGAIIGNYMLSRDGEAGAEVYSGASSEKQAWEVFRPAKLMTERSPGYKDAMHITVNAKTIVQEESASRFEPMIGTPGDGASPHCAIIDEFHEHKTSEQYDTMITGMGARTQPMLVIITTAGVNLSGPCYSKQKQVADVLAGVKTNNELFGAIYTLDEGDDWTDLQNWKKANPNYGVSVFEDYLKARLLEATQVASRQNIIRCKHLNQWMNANTAWMNMIAWNKCKKDVKLDDFLGYPCWVGIDLASKVDMAALMLLFHREGKFYIFGKYYLPSSTINLPQNDHYHKWRDDGYITETPGSAIDYGYIEEDLKNFAKIFDIKEVPYDPFQATQFAIRMMEEGLPMIEFGATVKNFSEPMKNLEALVLEEKFIHDGNPVLTWMASNVVAHYDAKDNIFPRKDYPENKIDGIVAGIMALGRATLTTDGNVESVYEQRDMIVL